MMVRRLNQWASRLGACADLTFEPECSGLGVRWFRRIAKIACCTGLLNLDPRSGDPSTRSISHLFATGRATNAADMIAGASFGHLVSS
jgi:hypothetical protein